MRFDEKGFVAERDDHCKQLFLKKIVDYDKQIAPTMRANGYKRVNSSERTVLFTFGEITFSRNRWRRGSKTRYPVDEWLGLKSICDIRQNSCIIWQGMHQRCLIGKSAVL